MNLRILKTIERMKKSMRGRSTVVNVSAPKAASEYSLIMKRVTEQYTASQMKLGGFFTDSDLVTFGSSTDEYIVV